MIRLSRLNALILALLFLASMTLSGCNFPGRQPTPDFLATSAAQTVEAYLVQATLETPLPLQPTITPQPPQPTIPSPTDTQPAPSPTHTSTVTKVPCDLASFVKDVTIPDGTELKPGEDFTKTWRLKNSGSCTWNSDYALIFDEGASMGGPASKALAGTVAPGETVDISVELTAPNTPGSHKGYWKLRNPSSKEFGVGSSGNAAFWVEIKVVPVTTVVNLTAIGGESGSVLSNGAVSASRNVGDTVANVSTQAFLSFDISGIPAEATITKVEANFSDFTTAGDPFGDLECLDLYDHPYGTLDAGDYVAGTPPVRLIRWCTAASLTPPTIDDDMVTALQNSVGLNRFQLRLQFKTDLSGDNQDDMVQFGLPVLKITYYKP